VKEADGSMNQGVPKAERLAHVLRSRLLVVTAASDVAELRMSAYSQQAGEEGDILADHAEAGRAYNAPYHGPDILKSGEMSMVNKDMDFMERKYGDRIELRRWTDALIEAAGGQKW
jgi:hypothetical protein